MSDKIFFDFVVRMTKPTAEEVEEARKLGVAVDVYRSAKLEVEHEEKEKLENEAAPNLLFLFFWVAGMFGLTLVGGKWFQKLPGVFQCVGFGVMMIPAGIASSRLWKGLRERTRERARLLLRFWPLTLLGLFVALCLLAALVGALKKL